MTIIRTPNTTGSQSNTTLSGNISLEQGTNELVSYTTVNGNKVVAYRIDTRGIHYYDADGHETARYAPDGIHYYNTSGTEIVKIDANGTQYFNSAGTKIAQIDSNGTQYFNGSGVKIAQIDSNGTHYYDENGVELTKISTSGFEYYDTSGNKRISIGASSSGKMRMLFYDTGNIGRTIIGQNPNGGDQVVAVSISGHDVETELSS